MFNRLEARPGSQGRIAATQEKGLDPYWKESSNPENFRLAYFLYFMPSNLYRVASVWAELARLGFRWPHAGFRGIEFGAGPASGATGIAAGERHSPVGLPKSGSWALIEQDKAMLQLGQGWAENYFDYCGVGDWGIRPFHRKLDLAQGFLPRSAPTFHLWLMSYFLNEYSQTPAEIARALLSAWERHLEEDGIAILVEPALRMQSRKLLEVRRELLALAEKKKIDWLQVLLPCLGHQACGALATEDDWCHEEVMWWRPPYFRKIDELAELDRKTLPFSYLVVTKSRRKREEILPALGSAMQDSRLRLVSPAHFEGRDQEFFVCGSEGKRRARFRENDEQSPLAELGRGDILLGADIRGDMSASRIEKVRELAGASSGDTHKN